MKRKFEMYQYRQVLVRMRQGDSDRDIDRSKIMGGKKLAAVGEIATERGRCLVAGSALPDDAPLAVVFGRKEFVPASCISSADPWREQIAQWHDSGVPGTTIHSALVRNHGYAGSYSSVYRLLQQLKADVTPDVPMRLEFKPAEAAQVDLGAGPGITDEIYKMWFFVMTLCWSRHQYVELCGTRASTHGRRRADDTPVWRIPRCPHDEVHDGNISLTCRATSLSSTSMSGTPRRVAAISLCLPSAVRNRISPSSVTRIFSMAIGSSF